MLTGYYIYAGYRLFLRHVILFLRYFRDTSTTGSERNFRNIKYNANTCVCIDSVLRRCVYCRRPVRFLSAGFLCLRVRKRFPRRLAADDSFPRIISCIIDATPTPEKFASNQINIIRIVLASGGVLRFHAVDLLRADGRLGNVTTKTRREKSTAG